METQLRYSHLVSPMEVEPPISAEGKDGLLSPILRKQNNN